MLQVLHTPFSSFLQGHQDILNFLYYCQGICRIRLNGDKMMNRINLESKTLSLTYLQKMNCRPVLSVVKYIGSCILGKRLAKNRV